MQARGSVSPSLLPSLKVGHTFLGNQGFLLLGTEGKAPVSAKPWTEVVLVSKLFEVNGSCQH